MHIQLCITTTSFSKVTATKTKSRAALSKTCDEAEDDHKRIQENQICSVFAQPAPRALEF